MAKLQKEVIHAQLVSKAVLSSDENELHLLSQYAGVTMDPQVFKVILDLLRFNVPPLAIVDTLKSMCTQHQDSTSAMLGGGEPHHSQMFLSLGGHDSSANQLSGSRSISDRTAMASGSSLRSFSGDHHSQSSVGDASANITKDSSYGSKVDRPDVHHITVRQRGSAGEFGAEKYKDRPNKKR